jgi:hypothetical protein
VSTLPATDLNAWDELAQALAQRPAPGADQPLAVPVPARELELAPQPDGTILARSAATGNQQAILAWHVAEVLTGVKIY